MPRNGPATRRELAPDPVYRSVLVTQVVNKVLSRGKRTLAERLAGEILDASNNIGASVKRREDMHKMAESNRAFAHYRW